MRKIESVDVNNRDKYAKKRNETKKALKEP